MTVEMSRPSGATPSCDGMTPYTLRCLGPTLSYLRRQVSTRWFVHRAVEVDSLLVVTIPIGAHAFGLGAFIQRRVDAALRRHDAIHTAVSLSNSVIPAQAGIHAMVRSPCR